MKSIRTLTFALIILAAAHLVALTVHVPAVVVLLQHAGFAAFLPLSLSTASGITNDRTVLLATATLVVLVTIARPIDEIAHALVPIGLGIVIGTLVGKGIRESQEQRHGEPVHRDAER